MSDETEIAEDVEGAAQGATYLTALLTVIGFALYWSALCALLFSSAFSTEGVTPMDGYLLRALFLVGFCVIQLLSSTALPDALDTRRRRSVIRIATCLVTAALTVLAILPNPAAPLAVQAVLWFALGAGSGEMLVFWGVVWSGIDAERAENSFCSTCVATSVLVAALTCSAMLFAPRELSAAVALSCCVISSLLQRVCGARVPATEPISSSASRERFDLWGPAMLTPAAPALALGVALALNGLVLGVDTAFPTALVGIGAGSLAALVVIALRGATPAASSVERVTFPVFGACLLALPFTSGTAAFQAIMAALVADLAAYLVFHWNVLVLLAYRKHLKPVYHFGQGLISTATAAALGWAAIAVPVFVIGDKLSGYAAAGWGQGGAPSVIAGNVASLTLVGCLVAVFVLVVVLSIVPYASNRAIEDLFSPAADLEAEPTEPAPDPWEAACEAICDERSLTPREREVFAYLARGRNAEHIAGELFISVHTAKTHTARIYRKLEINSQQQLLDLVEQRESLRNERSAAP